MLVREIVATLTTAVSDLTAGAPPMCCSQGSMEWKQTCDCAILGALHRVIKRRKIQHWNATTVGKVGDRLMACVEKLVACLEQIRVAVINESTMSKRQGGAHNNCTPWRRLTVEDLLAKHKVEDLVPLEENASKQQAAA